MNILSFIGNEYENINFEKLNENEIIQKIEKIEKIDFNTIRYLFINSNIYNYQNVLKIIKKKWEIDYNNLNKKCNAFLKILH